MNDLISRQEAIDAINDMRLYKPLISDRYVISDCLNKIVDLPSAEPDKDALDSAYAHGWTDAESKYRDMMREQRWIPVKTRPMDKEEREYWSDHYGYDVEYEDAVLFDCKMPDDGQEVWVCSKCGNVWQDTCQSDEGIYLEENGDWLDIVAWMPFVRPEPWKGEAE